VSRYQKGKTNLDFTEARDSEWQWHQLGYMQVCISLQTDNHASTPPLKLLQAGCPYCRPTNSVKALKAQTNRKQLSKNAKCILHVFLCHMEYCLCVLCVQRVFSRVARICKVSLITALPRVSTIFVPARMSSCCSRVVLVSPA